MENLNDLCRVCLHKSTDIQDDRPMVFLNKTQIEKLIYIGDPSEVVRFDGQPPRLCLQCLEKLDPVYDFVAKFNSSKLKLKSLQFFEDANQAQAVPQVFGVDTKQNEHLIDIVKMEPQSFEDDEMKDDGVEEVVIDDANFQISYQNDADIEAELQAHPDTVPKSKKLKVTRKFKLPKSKHFSHPSHPNTTIGSMVILPEREIKSEMQLNCDSNERLDGVNGADENTCHICTKRFSTRANMLRHVREHLGRRFVCKYPNCDSIFTQKSSLNVHILKHEDIKPHACETCGKKFSQHKSLVFHIRTHTGESPFECVYCDKAFKQKSNLIRHFKSHSKPAKPYQRRFECHKCHKYLASKQSLRRHLERHDRLSEEITQTPTEAIKIEKNP